MTSESESDFKKFCFRPGKKLLAIIALIACTLTVCAGVTIAYLTSVAGPVENTFTIGNITIELKETTGETYNLIPGKVIAKDPKVTVKADSEACWLFVKITKSEYFDEYLTYLIDDGWTHLSGYGDVYYRSVAESDSDHDFYILKDNSVTVKDSLTEEKMSAITNQPTISFNAYAVQSYGVDTAFEAWVLVLGESE